MRNLNDKIKDRVIGTIYHYTNAEGFKEIIKTREIWMTNALFVNDKTELRTSLEGCDIFKGVQFKNPEFNVFKNERQRPESKDVEDYYLASFSEEDNSLDQFRAYGDYCIGFDAKKLRKDRFNLFKCVYRDIDIKNWIIKKGVTYKGAAFFNLRFAVLSKLKNKHHKSEREIRLLIVSNSSWDGYTNSPEMFCRQPAIYFRHSNVLNVPVPYVKFFIPKEPKTKEELEKMVRSKSQIETKKIIRNMETEQERKPLPINKVKIGPMQHQEEAVFATKIFLLENGYDKVEVIPSDIPYRGF
jgi:hypothetical protein